MNTHGRITISNHDQVFDITQDVNHQRINMGRITGILDLLGEGKVTIRWEIQTGRDGRETILERVVANRHSRVHNILMTLALVRQSNGAGSLHWITKLLFKFI